MSQASKLPPAALPRKSISGLNIEIVIAVLVSLVAIAAIIASRKFPGTGLSTDIGSARFPLIYSCILLFLCALLTIQNLTKSKGSLPDTSQPNTNKTPPEYLKTFTGIVASVLCLGAMPYFGYASTTVIYLSFLMWLLGMRHKALNPVLAIAITAVLYFAFSNALNVPLPTGSFFE